ncbi:L protein [avian paramyxovirus 11]|uniref:RNA-directed RNA polymerase L n=1 Tax=avian paramyxovirus 11 TaxID=2560310 RepID=I6U0Z3_9MONO|nr:L protein [Avian paramyxovirus 11]AFN06859.1 L protein [Avian paramyxovirus 11]
MEVKQSDQIILPEVHLNSPIVKNKLKFYWQILGLPLPAELTDEYDDWYTRWDDIMRRESKTARRFSFFKDKIIAGLKKRGLLINSITPVVHPRTLLDLTTIETTLGIGFMEKCKKTLYRTIKDKSTQYKSLFLKLSRKLTSTDCLFSVINDLGQQDPLYLCADDLIENPAVFESTKWSHPLMFWLYVRQVMRHLIRGFRSQPANCSYQLFFESTWLIGVLPEILVLINTERNYFTILTFEMVLMYTDLVEGRNNLLAIAPLNPLTLPLVPKLDLLIELIDRLALEVGNDVYNTIASLESLAYGAVQLHDRSVNHAGEFFSFVLSEIEEELKSKLDPKSVLDFIRIIRGIYSGLTTDQAAEMLCIMRIWGHPLLSARRAAKKVRDSMCAPKMINLDIVFQVLAFFKAQIINGYRKSHSGLWPNIRKDSIHSDHINTLYLDAAEIPYSTALQHYRELSLLEFEKSIDFDLGADLSCFLKDKAISRPQSQWLNSFRHSLLPVCKNESRYAIDSTNRLLLDFLQSSDFNPQEEFEYVTSMAYLDDVEFCASYSLKEKEIKTDGRIFAKLTRKMRSCQVLLEALLAEHVCDFFAENGVSMEQLALTKSLLAMSQLSPRVAEHSPRIKREGDIKKSRLNIDKQFINHDSLDSCSKNDYKRNLHGIRKEKITIATFLTTDLQKYCLNWRYESIKLFAMALNQLFGIPHGYEWHHLRLQNTTMFVGDPFNPPLVLDSQDLRDQQNDDIFIVSPRGGIEGLCQKMWTMISISAINCAATKVGCRVASMVQGDNQVIAITKEIKKGENASIVSEELDNLGDTFFNEFKQINFGLGHNLKLKETIKSQSFFVYSKRIFFEGKILSQSLKNALKLQFVSDHVGENTVASCSTISSTVARLIENGFPKDTAFILNLISITRQLLFDETYSITNDYTAAEQLIGSKHPLNLAKAVLIPGQTGGYNFLNLARLFTRNIGDPITCSLFDIKMYISAGLLDRYVLRNIVLRTPGDGSWVTLCMDPYALNIPYIQLPLTYLKKHTQRSLLHHSSNPLLSGVRIDTQVEEEGDLCQFLLDREVVLPRVAHVILDNSVLGRRRHIQGLIDTTPTIVRHALNHHPISRKKLDLITDYSLNYLIALHDNILHPQPEGIDPLNLWETGLIHHDTCSVTLADFTRATSWSNLLNGRRISGITTPDTLELVSGCLITRTSRCTECALGDSKFTWFYLPAPIDLSDPSQSDIAQRVPYVGSKTEERRAASLSTIKGMTNHLRASLRLASVYIWAYGDTDQNWEQIHTIVKARCNITLNELRILCPIPSSSNIQHRLIDGVSTVKFTPASLARLSSYVHICNDEQRVVINDQSVESNLIYQQIMLLGLGIFETLYPIYVSFVNDTCTLHLHTGNSCCIREVESGSIVTPNRHAPAITSTPQNPFLYDHNPVPESQAPELYRREFRFNELNLDNEDPLGQILLLTRCVAKLMIESVVADYGHSSVKNDAIITYDNSVNWISETLGCDLRYLVKMLGYELCSALAYQMYYLRIRTKDCILLYIDQALQRIPGLQLANIAITLTHKEIFRRLSISGLIPAMNAPHLATCDFIQFTRQIIHRGASIYLTELESGEEPTYLLPNQLDGDLGPKAEQLLARRMCLMTLLYPSSRPLPLIRSLTPIEKCQVLTDFLLSSEHIEGDTYVVYSRMISLTIHPKIDSIVTNLYFLSRKILANIRSDPLIKSILEELYTQDLEFDQISAATSKDFCKDPLISNSLSFSVDLTSCGRSLSYIPELSIQDSPSGSSQFSLSQRQLRRHLFKSVGTSSTSWYKYAGLYSSEFFRGMPQGDALYLGEGSGAVMSFFEFVKPSHTIWYNSLFSSSQNPPQRNYGPSPTQFLRSTVYQNLDAGIPCKDGFVQQFCTLWNEVDDATDLLSDNCVNYIIDTVPALSCKLVVVEAEFERGLSWESVRIGLINCFILGCHSLMKGGRFVVKVNAIDTTRYHFVLSAMIHLFTSVNVYSCAYCNLEQKEVLVVGSATGSVNRHSVLREIIRIGRLIDQCMTLVPDQITTCIWKNCDDIAYRMSELCDKIIEGRRLITLTTTDSLLLQIGGTIITSYHDMTPSTTHLNSQDLARLITSVLDTLLKEVFNLLYSESISDSTLLLSPYNLSMQGKISTLATTTVRSLIPIWIQNGVRIKGSHLAMIITTIELGTINISKIMTTKEYITMTSTPKFIKRTFKIERVKWIFEQVSSIILSYPEIKYWIKYIGAAIKCSQEMSTPH